MKVDCHQATPPGSTLDVKDLLRALGHQVPWVFKAGETEVLRGTAQLLVVVPERDGDIVLTCDLRVDIPSPAGEQLLVAMDEHHDTGRFWVELPTSPAAELEVPAADAT